jgi:hypothetical protein
MKKDIRYELVGCIAGMPLDVNGKGEMDFDNGSYELAVKFPRVPMHWDPAFTILICCDRLLGFFAKEQDGALNLMNRCGPGYHIFDREFPTRRPNGTLLAHGRASSTGGIVDGVLYSRSQIISGEFNLGLDERIAKIHVPYHATMRDINETTLLMSSIFTFDTNIEKGCWGYATYPIISQARKALTSGNAAVVSVNAVQFHNTRSSFGGCDFSFRVQSSIKNATI